MANNEEKECTHMADDWVLNEKGETVCPKCDPSILEDEDVIDCIVWDLETTGFVPPEAKILEIGCFVIRGDNVEHKHWVFQNNCEIPEKITEITGITKEIIDAEGTDPIQNLKEFLPLFKKAKKNITHNGVRFDIPFLIGYSKHILGWTPQQEMTATNLIRSTTFDTAVHYKAQQLGETQEFREPYVQFADRVMNQRVKGLLFNLAHVSDAHGIDRTNIVQHRALADVYLTYEIYKSINAPKSEVADPMDKPPF